MNTLVLNAETATLPIANVLEQAVGANVEVRDAHGKVVAFILSPASHQEWIYAEANLDLDRHLSEVRTALARRGGITTVELLAKAASSAP